MSNPEHFALSVMIIFLTVFGKPARLLKFPYPIRSESFLEIV